MRLALWPETSAAAHQLEMGDILRFRDRQGVILAVDESDSPIGFVEVSVRQDDEKIVLALIGYVEGWYVDESHRGQGVGRSLIDAAADWAGNKGLTELASDAVLENEASIKAHKKIGFAETSRIVTFRKKI